MKDTSLVSGVSPNLLNSLYFSVGLSVSAPSPLPVFIYVCLSTAVSLCMSLPLSVSVTLCLYRSMVLSVFLMFLSVSFSLSLSLFLYPLCSISIVYEYSVNNTLSFIFSSTLSLFFSVSSLPPSFTLLSFYFPSSTPFPPFPPGLLFPSRGLRHTHTNALSLCLPLPPPASVEKDGRVPRLSPGVIIDVLSLSSLLFSVVFLLTSNRDKTHLNDVSRLSKRSYCLEFNFFFFLGRFGGTESGSSYFSILFKPSRENDPRASPLNRVNGTPVSRPDSPVFSVGPGLER